MVDGSGCWIAEAHGCKKKKCVTKVVETRKQLLVVGIGCENMKRLLEAVGKNVHKISDK